MKKLNIKILLLIVLICSIAIGTVVMLINSNNNNNNISTIMEINETEPTTMSTHKGTITYNGTTKEVEVIDYQINYFNLSELFINFDSSVLHNLETNGTAGTIRKTENAYSKGNNTDKLNGNILYIYGYGKTDIAQYEISDNFSINITDSILSSSLNWDNYVKALDIAETSSIAGVSLLTFKIEVNNISDDDLVGNVTNVFLNNSPIASNFITDIGTDIWKHSKDTVTYPASQPALASAGEKDIDKIGFEVQLTEKETGNQVYKNTIWLNLE